MFGIQTARAGIRWEAWKGSGRIMPRVDHRLRVPPAISAEVVARYGNDCWLDMPGCTKVGDTSDHIVPHVFGGPTIVKNLRRACRHCNGLRRERILSGWPSVIHAVIGPPCAGKTTWVLEHMQPGDIIVAGANFGCGSSREHAPLAIKACGVKCVIAPSFARIFYRNAINIGLPILECPAASEAINEGDVVAINFDTGVITDETTGQTFQAAPFPPFIQKIIKAGGLMKSIQEGK